MTGISKMTPGQRALILSAIKPGSRVLEIGTYHGATAALLAEAVSSASVLSIDIFRKVTPDAWCANRRDNMTLFLGTVQEFAAFSGKPVFDVAIVDADHRYPYCLNDLLTAKTLLSDAGRLFAHDYAPDLNKWPGVQRSVDEFCAQAGMHIVSHAGSLVELGGAS